MVSPDLRLTRLTLTNFRNYPALRLNVTAGLIALHGSNGAGKTNLLEATSLLSPGRGLRGSAYEELAHAPGLPGLKSWAVAAELTTSDQDIRLATGWSEAADREEGKTGRMVLINGHVQKSSGSLSDQLRLLWLTPAMDRLFAGPAGDRRRFLDRLVVAFDPQHGSRLGQYEKLMRERNLVLAESHSDRLWLDSLEAPMAEVAIALAAARVSAIEALQKQIFLTRGETAFPWGEVRVSGEIEALVTAMPAVRAEDEYRMMLSDSRNLDKAAGRTLKGPHRSDFLVDHGPKNMPAALCSTGEQKALLIGLILAQASAVKKLVQTSPVLLLDEVAAHLDGARRHGLFATLSALGCQSWMTGTDRHLFADLPREAQIFHVDNAQLQEEKRP